MSLYLHMITRKVHVSVYLLVHILTYLKLSFSNKKSSFLIEEKKRGFSFQWVLFRCSLIVDYFLFVFRPPSSSAQIFGSMAVVLNLVSKVLYREPTQPLPYSSVIRGWTVIKVLNIIKTISILNICSKLLCTCTNLF